MQQESLRRELELFPDWYLTQHKGAKLSAEDRRTVSAVTHPAEAQASVSLPRSPAPAGFIRASCPVSFSSEADRWLSTNVAALQSGPLPPLQALICQRLASSTSFLVVA